ncbi:transglycosylase SLT domain-containing protein [Lysobacter enzymogenes]|uniref:LysM peptidoglycan-binding domain-containing protein n=1 Tax=Lysobacter enzymogenes TaxID=69 RepID=A0A3N2RG48_LYSEN|nr:transglycosylase SLT domain-containing protein [Lysobacter enzymogenes]ROU06399.1 LysM peptidoglycan-binding domain-containing protein [Lysobacter enzymogenes]
MPAYSRSARAARVPAGLRAAVAPLAAALALCSLSPQAAALSKRDQASVDALTQRMQSAETRYQSALVKIRNADPTGRQDSDAALEDMEDVIAACLKQKGCAPTTMLAGYKRLLKANADSVANTDEDAEDAGQLDSDGLAADVPEAARAAALLSDDGQRFVKMVQYNPAVQAGIRRWLTDLRGPLMQSYDNYQYMRQLMWPEFQRAGLPEALLFGIMAKESNGRVHSTSRVGAAGPLQFMFATGKRFGLGDDGSGFDTRYDPKQSAQAAAEYLNERLGQLNNSIEMSLAAYNGGEGRALRINNASGGRNFWDESVYNQFPAETRDYVPMVVAAAWLFLHPREYGLNFPKVDSKLAQLRLSKPSSIYELTICMGGAGSRDGYMRALRNLNPRYQADSYLSAGTTLNATTRMVSLYNRWCTQGKRAELARTLVASDASSAIVRTGPLTVLPVQGAGEDGTVAYAGTSAAGVPVTVATGRPAPAPKAEPKKKATPKDYKIQRGDTLTDVAKKFSCDTRALAKANGLKAPRYAVKPGQRIKLSGCGD